MLKRLRRVSLTGGEQAVTMAGSAPVIFGVEIHATVTANLLNHDWIRRSSHLRDGIRARQLWSTRLLCGEIRALSRWGYLEVKMISPCQSAGGAFSRCNSI